MHPPIVVAALYRFVRLDDPAALRAPLLDLMRARGLRGTLLLATEGINGTVAGDAAGIDALLARLLEDTRFDGLECKRSYTDAMPFHRARVKLKREIVTLGVDGVDPAAAGSYVEPADWNALVDDPDVTVIDTRNSYESAIGSFAGALQPNTESFRDFPAYVDAELDPRRQRKVAMFCTGGIRCEKATAYLRQRGFDEVFQLRGGILRYLEEVPASESRWRGECFVFDDRVSVNHALEAGSYDQCHACRRPISEADKQSEFFQAGVSCPACFGSRDAAARENLRERERQVRLARERGETHFGDDANASRAARKAAKLAAKAAQRRRAVG